MSDESALLAAIYANPDEDTPRLVYADWLDEHDQPERAEFIRVQIELAKQEDTTTEEFQRLSSRESELEVAQRERWKMEFEPFGDVRFARGFPDFSAARDAEPDDFALLRRVPTLRHLWVTYATLDEEAVHHLASLQQLEGLQIWCNFEPPWLEHLEALPCWTWVYIHNPAWEAEVEWAAFQERRISKVTELPPKQQRLAAIRYLRGREFGSSLRVDQPIRKASLWENLPTDAELRLLSYLPELEEIEIHRGRETVAGLRHLSELPNLKRFCLSDTMCESLVPITNCTTLETLEFHSLGGTFGDESLVGLERLKNLRHLMLDPGWKQALHDATLHRIGELHELRTLYLHLGQLDDQRSLAALTNLTKLESLDLYCHGDHHLYLSEAKGNELQEFLASL